MSDNQEIIIEAYKDKMKKTSLWAFKRKREKWRMGKIFRHYFN